jgi:hypothetical protein
VRSCGVPFDPLEGKWLAVRVRLALALGAIGCRRAGRAAARAFTRPRGSKTHTLRAFAQRATPGKTQVAGAHRSRLVSGLPVPRGEVKPWVP